MQFLMAISILMFPKRWRQEGLKGVTVRLDEKRAETIYKGPLTSSSHLLRKILFNENAISYGNKYLNVPKEVASKGVKGGHSQT